MKLKCDIFNSLKKIVIIILPGFFIGTNSIAQNLEILQQQVRDAETAFAKTMADRDFESSKNYVSEEAVFISDTTARRGRVAIAAYWKQYFSGPDGPFSWHPQTVVVLASGKLALSTGPVYDSSGKMMAYFNSTWRLEAPGVWRVVFDKGFKACD